MFIYKPHSRSKIDMLNTKKVFEEIGRSGGFEVPLRPIELKLSLFVKAFFGEDDKYSIIHNKDNIYGRYTGYLSRFCYGTIGRSRHIRFDIGFRSNIKNLMYYNVYFQNKIKFVCKTISKRRPKIQINSENDNIANGLILISYFDHKSASSNDYSDFIISHIVIARNKIGPSRRIQRDEEMNSILRVNSNSDKYDKDVESCNKLYRIKSIRLKHPILTADNYEKVDNMLEFLYNGD